VSGVVGYEVRGRKATLFDGIARHSPERRWFQQFAAENGFAAAVRWRDSGRPIPDGGSPVPAKTDLDEE
jgi:hypothetical protein